MGYVPYQVPQDVDEQIRRHQARIAQKRGVRLTLVSKSGDVLRDLLAIADAAEAMGITPDHHAAARND